MGAHLSVPELKVESENKENDEFIVSLQSMQGYRSEMEDAHIIELNPPNLPGWSFFGVFDGHAGDGCSKYVAQNLVNHMFKDQSFITAAKHAEATDPFNSYYTEKSGEISNENENLELTKSDYQTSPKKHSKHIPDLKDCIISIFKELDAEFHNKNPNDKSGSTATCILISPKTYYFINLGDSRSILCGPSEKDNLVFSTVDHKPSDMEERARIENAGGEVSQGRINSLLAVSRAFGDYDYKDINLKPEDRMVSVIPTIISIPRSIDHTGIICACDGVWDIYFSSQASLFVKFFWRASNDLQEISKRLLFSSLDRGSKDNISLIAIQFKGRSVDQYSESSDESVYFKKFKDHVDKQSDFYLSNIAKIPKYDFINPQKFKVREAVKMNNNFMRSYAHPNQYVSDFRGGYMSFIEVDHTPNSQPKPQKSEENDQDSAANSEQVLKTHSDFQDKEALFAKYASDSQNILSQLGPDIFYEEIQLKAEKILEDSISAEIQSKQGHSN